MKKLALVLAVAAAALVSGCIIVDEGADDDMALGHQEASVSQPTA